MKHKEKECTWAPGMQDADITYAGAHTWAAIRQARGAQEYSLRNRWALSVIGVVVVAVAFWWLG